MEEQESIKKAIALTRKNRYREALAIFEKIGVAKKSAAALSYHALCVAAVKKDYDRAATLCNTAAKKEFYDPEIYLNVARVCILADRRDFAFRALKKGLKLDSTHEGLLKHMKQLGIRRAPPIPFLPRDNPFNKLLGALGERVGKPKK
ncbi:MAG: hypothetical protein V3W31_03395 [Thermodesulfobacteriota bacterium]